jgi:cytochrome c553
MIQRRITFHWQIIPSLCPRVLFLTRLLVTYRIALLIVVPLALCAVAAVVALVSVSALGATPPAGPAPGTMQAHVLGCAACHGQHGEGTDNDYFPRLSGKPAGYIYNQLVAFRDGRRKYPPMNYLLAYLPDAYLQQIAKYFASQHPTYRHPETPDVDAEELARGKLLAMSGDHEHGIPACASCHGASLNGEAPAIPGLLGLHPGYISAQLGAWRYGTRHAAEPDCMHEIASRLSDRDITAISAWLATLPAPEAGTPAVEHAANLPLECGSVPHQARR